MGFPLLAAITFIAAFLLFQIELIIAKLFLPVYGGSYLVWGACVVFFQAVLLAGYVFTHTLISRVGFQKYIKIHLVFLFLPLLFFPGRDIQMNTAAFDVPLVLDVFLRLCLTIGPVFFILSTISLFTQAWVSCSTLKETKYPHVLYAVSNLGSFGALLSFPFLFEQFLTSSQQLIIWRIAYGVLIGLNILALYKVPVVQVQQRVEEQGSIIPWQTKLRWLVLSMAGVILFLSVTNIITYEVAPIPLLWIVPLSIYLLSFVLCFRAKPWFPVVFRPLVPGAMVAGLFLFIQIKMSHVPAVWSIILLNVILFILCLYAQKELIARKPMGKSLTLFYVMIALGGFLGGMVTSWVIPLVSTSPIEFVLGLVLLASVYHRRYLRFVVLAALLIVHFSAEQVKRQTVVKWRNFYGIYEIFDKNDGVRTFLHGTTLHGLQWMDVERQKIPLGYYSPNTPMGQVFIKDIFEVNAVGAVGLGAGTLAIYNKLFSRMDIYELDPDVVKYSKKYFTYLQNAPGMINIIVGDARLSLKKSDAVYDLMVIDAFGGDAIPVHLINRDVLKLYRSHLSARGGILFHIPSRYFNLDPVLARIAEEMGAYAAVKTTVQDGISLRSQWAVITWDQERFTRLVNEEGWKQIRSADYPFMRTFSDDYSSVLPIIQMEQIWGGLTHFRLLK